MADMHIVERKVSKLHNKKLYLKHLLKGCQHRIGSVHNDDLRYLQKLIFSKFTFHNSPKLCKSRVFHQIKKG